MAASAARAARARCMAGRRAAAPATATGVTCVRFARADWGLAKCAPQHEFVGAGLAPARRSPPLLRESRYCWGGERAWAILLVSELFGYFSVCGRHGPRTGHAIVLDVIVRLFLRAPAPTLADPIHEGGVAELLDPVAKALRAPFDRHGGDGKVGQKTKTNWFQRQGGDLVRGNQRIR
eukprot:7175518-Pyramimonas_sp.AAC.1